MRRYALILAAAASLAAAAVGAAGSAGKGRTAAPPAKSARYTEERLKTLETRLAKRPNDAKLKLEVAEAHYQVGHAAMMNPDLPPRVKYPTALKHFRRALVLNPKHAKAAQEKKMIEDIYRSMGRPIPQ